MQHRFFLDFPDSLRKYYVLKATYNKKYVTYYKIDCSDLMPTIYMGTLCFFARY